MDNDGWQEHKPKKNKKKNFNNHYNDMPVSTGNCTLNLLLTPENVLLSNVHEIIDTTVKKKGDITILMKYILDGDLEKKINEKLIILSCTHDGKICKLWDVLFMCLKKFSLNTQYFKECSELRNHFNKNNQNQKNYIDDDIIYEICNYFKIQLKISSIDINTRDIVYKGNISNVIHLLHVGFEYFIPLKSGSPDNKYKISAEETKLISELRILNKNTGVNQKILEREKKLLNDIRKKLKGMEKQESYVPTANYKGKSYFYRIYSPELLDQRKDLIRCKLKFINAHSGKAIPVDYSENLKRNEIKLISRQNCGYNAFENDIVLVKINDPVNHTGKVMGVVESNHKPVNSIYICKVSRDQGSLMTPLDKSFPKIHVDNQPGRRKYEMNKSKSLTDEQKSTVDIEKESAKYADNLCFSLFDITINEHSEKPIFNLKKVENFNPETCEYFFIVCFEYWDPHFMYPNGKIVGTISSHESLKDNFHLISSICNIEPLETSPQYKIEVEQIRKKAKCVYVPGSYIPSDSVVFTIDDVMTKDMDDAISYHKDGNDIIIGVHISDVTKYVLSTHEIYRQAESRFCTCYPPKFSKIPPVHILDESLATDVLSLVPNEPRAVVSVFFRFTENMISSDFQLKDIIQPTFKEGIIVSQYKLNYDEVSLWLRAKEIPSTVNENLFYALSLIYNIAKKIRRARLPESYFVHSVNDCYHDMKIETHFEAHILIEEFMLMANEYVARKIYEVYPNFSLLRMQDAVENFEEWKENLFKQTNMNFAGQLKEYCNLLKIRVSDFETRKKLIVSKKFVDKFKELLKTDVEKARNLLQYDVYYNDFYVHITQWYEINNAARYECSIQDCKTNGHFSLNKCLYTHFTSPIRRFVDIVVHRLLKSVINGIRIDDDITLDIHSVCTIANKKLSGNKTFEKICAPFAIFDETEKMFCFILDCACSEINNEELRFAHPLLQKAASKKEINFADLSLNSVPLSLKINEKVESCILKWRKIIFSCSSQEFINSSSNKFIIDNNVFDSFLLDSSHKLFQEIRRSYLSTDKLIGKLTDLKNSFIIPNYENVISSDSISISNPIIDIEIKIFIKNTLRIQFCKYKVNGLPKISPELYIVAPTFQICVIHRDDPVRYFISGGKLKLKHNDIKKVFQSIKEYQEYFEPLILIESLEETLADSSAFTLLSVPILWVVGSSSVNSCKNRYGVIILSQEFCKIRNIIFNDEKEEIIDRYEYLIEKGFSSVGGDLLCLRYKIESWKNYWVGHGEVVYVGKYRNEGNNICKVIIFRLTQSDYDSFSNNSVNSKYTIDVYLKSIVSKRQQEAISSVNNHPLLKEVILGRQELSLPDNNENFINSLKNEIQNKNIFKFNRNQSQAMSNAMNQKLSLIWGPPGTGKTHIGCILSYGFTKKNHDKKNGGVVLYCGPSNDCVNLVASEMQKKFSDLCPKLIRIFGEQQELADFPIPGFISKNNVKLTGEISEISLHYLIRKNGAKYADALRKYDNHFSYILNPDTIYNNSDNNLEKLHRTIMAYRDTVKEAKKQWIKDNRYDMVLCTTSVTALSIMELFNVTQVIIDEAGMCKEPETLIPISSVEKTVQNVVLIGDHKQLRPIIHSKVANKRGLQISLFERYQELKPELVTMLNFQYRMHPSICEFPSKEFYSGRLKTQISTLWTGLSPDDMECGELFYEWNGIDYRKCKRYYRSVLRSSNYNAILNKEWPGHRNYPFRCFRAEFDWYPERIVFFNVIGDEVIQSVTTSTGNENSRGNNQEVEAVGCIYRKIIKRLNPPRLASSYITVLTQYKLQQHLIQLKCNEILKQEKIRTEPQVKTVIRSQGSENDYIIFSTVRSLRNKEDINDNPTPGWEKQYLGFITDPNQVNVALTRAKKGLIIIGNKELLRVNKIWKRLINDLEYRNCVMENYLDFLP